MDGFELPLTKSIKLYATSESKIPPRCEVPAVNICEDALLLAMECLCPRDLLRISSSCKVLRESITTSLVVKSAMIHGGHAKTTVSELYKLVKPRSIYVPSPLRLLRLVNGKRCEFCFQSKVNFVRPYVGVFACWTCLTERGLTKAWRKSWVRYKRNSEAYDAVFYHPRVACSPFSSIVFLWARRRSAFSSAGMREFIGPIARFEDIDEMASSRDIETYLDNNSEAPENDSSKEFVEAYDEIIGRSIRVGNERCEIKRVKTEKAHENKMNSINKMILKLQPRLDERWRDLATKFQKSRPYSLYHVSRRHALATFEVSFVDHKLRPFVLTPSKMKTNKLNEVAEEINQVFQSIYDSKFLDYEFLSRDGTKEGLKTDCLKNLTTLDALHEAGAFSGQIGETFFEHLENGRLFEALCSFRK